MILGDASLQNTGTNSRIIIKHCRAQEEYLSFKKGIIEQVTNSNPIVYESNTYLKKTDKTYPGICLQSKSITYFEKLRKLTYTNGKKIITVDLLKRLNPLGLAIWYMDDGYLSLQYKKSIKNKTDPGRSFYSSPIISSRKIKLATHCFTEQENLIIQKYLRDYWHIDTVIYRPEPQKNPSQRALYMNARNALKFFEIVQEFMLLPLFTKKIDMKYSGDYLNKIGKDMVLPYGKL